VNTAACAALFRALSHPARVRIVELLVDGPVSVGELRVRTSMDSSGLAQQLTVLRRAGLVAPRRAGKDTEYALVSPTVADLTRCARGVLTGQSVGHERLLTVLRQDVLRQEYAS